MATNQLSDNDRSSIQTAMDQLFGRVITHFPCPLQTMDERRDLFWCSLDNTQLHALKVMHEHRTSVFYNRSEATISIDQEHVQIFLKKHDSSDNAGYFWGAPQQSDHVSLDRVYSRVPKAPELMEWLETTRTLGAECALAMVTFLELLRMCSTPGQVRRVLPELVDFMPTKIKLLLGKQTRASNTPFEWSAFDRSRVEQLTNTMAKCMLLAFNENQPHTWTRRGENTWPVINQELLPEKS